MTSVVCLNTHLDMSGSECLNMSDDHPLENCLSDNGAMLKSDCDEQLIISLAFNQVIIYIIIIQGEICTLYIPEQFFILS